MINEFTGTQRRVKSDLLLLCTSRKCKNLNGSKWCIFLEKKKKIKLNFVIRKCFDFMNKTISIQSLCKLML